MLQRHNDPSSFLLRDTARAVFAAAIAAVEPQRLVSRHLRRHANECVISLDESVVGRWFGPTLVVGAGKGAAGMAAACEAAFGDDVYGEVIVADGCARNLSRVAVSVAGHPLPDERGRQAAQRLVSLVGAARNGAILCLISGGASSLMVYPRPPISLADKIATTKELLACGADIRELNCVRKHISLIKGGGLLARSAVPVFSLIISDVVGDDPAVIGSGPMVPDPTSYADAQAVLRKYGLSDRIPQSVAEVLKEGCAGRLSESLKPRDPACARGVNLVIGSNAIALAAAADAARARGWDVHIEPAALEGDTTMAAAAFARRLRQHAKPERNLCVLAGGETTVQVRGSGRGGRNQEFAVALTQPLAGSDVCVLSAGTDGIDGPTESAGAFVDGTTLARARAVGVNEVDALQRNDSQTFLAAIGDLFVCGATGTNVMDIKIALLPAGASILAARP